MTTTNQARKTDNGGIGLTDREAKQFSFVRLITALADHSNGKAQQAAAFELDVCRTTANELSLREIRDIRSDIVIPFDILRQPITDDENVAESVIRMFAQRDLVVGTASAGGNLVATDLLGQSFIDILRNRAVMMRICTVLNDLQGNVVIPRQTAATVGSWLPTEQGSASEDDAAFDQITLTPKEIGVFQEYSRQLLIQSSVDIEAFVRLDLVMGIATSVDWAVLNADGTGGAPTGIRNQTGVGDVDHGANGGDPTWARVVEFETDVSSANADVGSMLYLVNAATRGKLKTTPKESGYPTYLMPETGMEMNGYGVEVTNQLPANLTKGLGSALSAMVFGNFADCFIGLWGGVDLLVNPYSGDTTRTTRVTAYQDVDVAVRHPESFSVADDVVTA